MNDLTLILWPFFIGDKESIAFGLAFVLYGLFYAIPVVGAMLSIIQLSKYKKRRIPVLFLALSLSYLILVLLLGSKGLLSLEQPALICMFLPLGPILLLLTALGKFTRSARILIATGIALTYLVTLPWIIVLTNIK